MSNTHYFLAVPIPEKIKEEYRNWRDKSKSLFPFKSWVHHEDYHITLVFLGNTSSSELEKVIASIQQIVKYHSPFQLKLNGLGYFGKKESPRIFWGGIQREPELEELQKEVFESCKQIGYKLESRPYSPHLTLARRFKEGNEFPFNDLDSYFKIDESLRNFTVDSIVLYQTHLDRSPKYEIIETFKLSNQE